MCAGRESNSGLVRGRDVYYHCTTGADVVVSQCALHSACPRLWGTKGAELGRRRAEDRKLWRNGSALDSRPKGWGFESL